MSIKLMSQVWEKKLSPGQQRVLLVLCDHANDQGMNCYPSVEYIAWKIGITRQTVMRMIAELEEMGAIQVRRSHRQRSNYRIRLDRIDDKPPFKKDEFPDEDWPDDEDLGSQNVTQDENLGSQNVTQDVTKSYPRGNKILPKDVKNVTPTISKPSVEPLVEPLDGKSDSHESQPEAVTENTLNGLEGFQSTVQERKKKKSANPPAPAAANDDRRVWGMVDTYFTARDIPGNKVSKRERNQVYNIFAGLHYSISWEDIEGCTKYLRTVSWQQGPGQPSADMVARTVLDWIQKGRPQAEAPKKGGGTSGFAAAMGQFADYAKEQGQ